MTTWHPASTPPNDARIVLVAGKGMPMQLARYWGNARPNPHWIPAGSFTQSIYGTPTHWTEIPAPPKQEEK
jgi:hypothetical protein